MRRRLLLRQCGKEMLAWKYSCRDPYVGQDHNMGCDWGCKLVAETDRESSTSQKIQARNKAIKGSVISGTLPGRNICATSIAPSVAAAPAAAYLILQPLSRKSQTKVPYAKSFPRKIVIAATRSVSNNARKGIQEKGVAALVNWYGDRPRIIIGAVKSTARTGARRGECWSP